ncbi:class I SAM-dependent methyltransferase [Bdellovibrionota bacterium FG-2]
MLGTLTDLSAFESGEFDAILDGNCLHCILGEDRGKALREIHRVLRPNGIFFVSCICGPFTGGEGAPIFDPSTKSLLEEGKTYRHMASAASIFGELEEAGFQELSRDIQERGWWSHMKVLLGKG